MNLTPENFSVSIIIPVFNEAGNIAPLLKKITPLCAELHAQIIVVDDGSMDATGSELAAVKKSAGAISVLTLRRNFGQTAALAAGIDHSTGQIIITMDGDGQNDPDDIPALIAKLNDGYDVVSGWRQNRQDPFFSRKLPSLIANRLISFVTGVRLHDYGCTLKAYRKSIFSNLHIAGEMHRFLPAWCAWQGGKVAEISVRHHPRIFGKSKYGLIRTFKVLIDLLTLKFFSGYLFKPNYLFSGLGIVFLAMGGGAALLAVFDKFGPNQFPQFRIPLMLLAVFLGMVAVFLTLMGVLAELMVRLYFQVRNEKPYRLANE